MILRRLPLRFIFIALVMIGQSNISWGSAAQTFFDYSPSSQTIGGVQYPRKQNHLYRGTTDSQMDFSKAIGALLGDSSGTIESLFFSTIKNELMDVAFPLAVPLNSYLHQQIQNQIQQNKGPLSLSSAVTATKILSDKTFLYYDQKDTAISTYVNYRSSTYQDWPNDVVFTTFLSPLAGTYGNRVLVIREKKPRSLDLNYWNYANNSAWYDHTRDIGEFIAFGYIPAEDLTGYQVRTGSNKSWHSIQYAAYKPTDVTDTAKTLLLFTGLRQNGDLSSCIDLNSSDKTYYHCEFKDGSIIDSRPPLSKEKVRLAGIISLCTSDQESSCAKPTPAELSKYSRAKLPDQLIREIQTSLKKIKVRGQQIKLLVSQ